MQGDRPIEYIYQTHLVDIAVSQEDYSAAATHIARVAELWNQIKGGNFLFEKPVDRMFCAALYGSVFLRLGVLMPALGLFYEAIEARLGDNLRPFQLSGPPENFLKDAVFLARFGLFTLAGMPWKMISFETV